jgi:hypothetical protein
MDSNEKGELIGRLIIGIIKVTFYVLGVLSFAKYLGS